MSTMNSSGPLNPFRPAKFELAERYNIIWMSSQIRRLYEAQHYYVFGTRGSGKTSMLKALNWDERLNNPSILQQIEDEDPTPEFMAIYLRLPDYVSGEFARTDWSQAFPTGSISGLREAVFSLFLELISLGLAIEAVEGYRARGAIVVDRDRERDFVRGVLETMSPWVSDQPETLPGLLTTLRLCVRHIRRMVLTGPTRAEAAMLPLEAAGNVLFSHLSLLRDLPSTGSQRKISHFKVCLDDCEMLTAEQQTFVNSLVRRSKSPVFWIVSYVSPDYETTATTIPSQSLSSAERPVIDLDDEPEEEFRRFCEHVSAMRFWYAEHAEIGDRASRPQFSSQYFSLRRILGRFQINVSLAFVRRSGVSAIWEKLEPLAEALQRKKGFHATSLSAEDEFPSMELEGEKVLPYYQAFVLNELGKFEETIATSSNRDLTAASATVRRKQRAAWVILCNQVGVLLPFYGWQVAIALSDGCIRDYLEIMGELFDQCKKPDLRLADFRRTRIDVTTQRSAMIAAGQSKAKSIATVSRRFTAEAYQLVRCLGQLTHLLQIDANTINPLRAAELGVFSVDFSMLRNAQEPLDGEMKKVAAVYEVIKECKRYGLLRAVETQRAREVARFSTPDNPRFVERFRLHRRFAAGYGYSFRGPYGEVRIRPHDLMPVCLAPDQVDPKAWADGMLRKVAGGGRVVDQDALPLIGG